MNVEKISIVIPIYKNRDTLELLCSGIKKNVDSIGCQFEIILVNDGCPQNSWQTILKISALSENIIGLNLSRNFGQHIAIAAGIDVASGDWLVVMDADLQDSPEEISRLYIHAKKEGVDCVFAQRIIRKDKLLKKMSSKLFSTIYRLVVGTKRDKSVGNFGIYSKKAYQILHTFKEQHRFFPSDIAWGGFAYTHLEIKHNKRKKGASSYNIFKLLKLAFMVITTRTNRPLYFSVVTGALTATASLVFGSYIFYNAMFIDQYKVSGWSSLIVAIFFLSGIILFSVGILGIYLGHIFQGVQNRPLYVVKESTKSNEPLVSE